jgi:CRP-like cAMP-binding protein
VRYTRGMASHTTRLLNPGERTDSEGHAVKNKILLEIPLTEFRALRADLQFLKLPDHLVLHNPNERIERVYFLNHGMVSLVVASGRGRTVEVGVVGAEGAACIPAVVNVKKSPLQEVIQVAGEGFGIESEALQSVLKSTPQLRNLLNRFAILQTLQIAQTAACNRLHDIRERLARWLLMTQDRVPSAYLPITHDFLATMLGSDRPSVSLAAGVLQKKGAIKYVRAAVRVVNRNKLKECACECYAAMGLSNGELGLA